MSRYREITALLTANADTKRLANVFDDFVEMAALAIRNAVDHTGHDDREALYLKIAGQYSKEQLDRFAQALALVVLEMEAEPRDVLGRLYMEMGLGNDRLGQFYTPYDVAVLIATITMNPDAIHARIEEQGFFEVCEPACGAAAFIIAITQEMRRLGFNYQQRLHVTAEDISSQAVHMAYIHLTLLHVPAVVHRRDTLTQETFDSWPTPAHILSGWATRLRHPRDHDQYDDHDDHRYDHDVDPDPDQTTRA